MKLRDYQMAAVESIFQYFADGGKGNPITVLPTGTGKSLVIGEFIKRAYTRYPQTRVMKLTHVKELIEQNFDKLLKLWPTAPAGIYSAGLGRKECNFPITFGGVGTIAKCADIFGHIDLLLIDECHLVSHNEDTMYIKLINKLRKINPHLKVIGFTATHYRLGHGMLTNGEGLFTDVCFDATGLDAFNWFIEEGYLCPLIPKRTSIELDISKVHIQGGEFKQNELQAAVDVQEVTYSALNEAIKYGSTRRHWLIFASGIEHTEHVAEMLNSMDIQTTFVHSKLNKEERDKSIKGFKNGKFQAMVNNGILTTGFDFPGIDLIVMLRPTQSTGLWIQMLGRGTRPVFESGFDLETKEGRLTSIESSTKQDCLVLDFAGNTKRLGPINDPVLPKRKGKGGGEAPVKVCEICGTYNHASVRFCVHCKEEFVFSVKINQVASTDELIASGKEKSPVTEIFQVERVVYNQHQKADKPLAIQVSYFCGLRMFKEYVCLEHGGFASKKARDWWRDHSVVQQVLPSKNNIPETTSKALERLGELRTPTHIRVWINKQYPEILAYDYTDTAFARAAQASI